MKKVLSLVLVALMLLSAMAFAENTIKIGLYGTITGTNALAGEMLQKGAQLAIDQINEAGGVNGAQLVLVPYDDQSTPEGAVAAVTRLVDVDGVTAMVGSNSSPNIIAAASITEEAQVIQVGAGTSPSYTNAGYKYIFRGTANASLPNKAFVDAMTVLGCTKLAILNVATEYGTSGVDSVKALLPDGLEIVCEAQYQSTDTDFTGIVSQVIASGADGVVLYGTSADSALCIKQLRQNGYTSYIYGPEGLGAPDIINVGGEAAEGVVFGSGAVIPNTIEEAANATEAAMLTAFVEKYGEMPVSDVVYRGYDAACLIAEAMKTAKDSTSADSLREAFLNITAFDGVAGVYNFSDGSGDGLNTARTYIVSGGKNVLLDTYLAQ